MWKLFGKECNNKNNISHSKTGSEDDVWLQIFGAVHYGLIRQWEQRGMSIFPDMKYGGNICRLLLEDPNSLIIYQVMSNKHASLKHKQGV